METELIISHAGFPPLSARGCIQELTPITLGKFRRSINGDLVYLGGNEGTRQSKKYRTVIKCQDKTALATDDLLPGKIVEVQCIQRLWQEFSGQEIYLERKPVEASISAIRKDQRPLNLIKIEGNKVFLEGSDQPVYISYRPILTMRVIQYTLSTDEWGVKAGWQLELEEV